MPFGWVSAAAALYNAANSGGGGGGGSWSGVPGAMTYVPQWQGGADQMWQQIMQQFGSVANSGANTVQPFLMNSLLQGEGRIPWETARADSMGDTLDATGTRFLNAQDSLYNAGNSVMATASDPQQALYDRTLRNVTDQSRAASSARGIGMSPEAAGLENQATSNFNIDWQNQQLQRQVQGLQAMSGAYTAGGQQGLAAGGAYGDAMNMYTNANGLPFNLANMYGTSMGSSVYNPWNAEMGNLSQYMGLGQSGSQAAFGQNQTNMNNWTSAISSIPWNQVSQWFGGGATPTSQLPTGLDYGGGPAYG